MASLLQQHGLKLLLPLAAAPLLALWTAVIRPFSYYGHWAVYPALLVLPVAALIHVLFCVGFPTQMAVHCVRDRASFISRYGLVRLPDADFTRQPVITQTSNQAMQRTASQAAISFLRLHHQPDGCESRFTGLSVADLVSRQVFTLPVDSTPIKLYADTIPPVQRSMPGEVFVLRIEAYPQPGSPDFGTDGGALINCYVDADDLRTAELRAIEFIQREDWRPHRVDGWQLTCADCADETQPAHGAPSSRSLVGQAHVDGVVCIFHTWPIDAPDALDQQT